MTGLQRTTKVDGQVERMVLEEVENLMVMMELQESVERWKSSRRLGDKLSREV
jgi:hypothetical protein